MRAAILVAALALSGCAYFDAAKNEAIHQIGNVIAPPKEEKPFGGLDYTRQRQVVLRDGTVIQEQQIEKIVEILTPIVPAPIVRIIEPEAIATRPVEDAPTPTPTLPPATLDPKTISEALDALESLGK